MNKKIAVIYLCYGCEKYIPGFVAGLLKIDNKEDVKVFMVTNNSPDNIAEVTRREILPRSGKDLPEVELIDNDTNLGFSHGNNIGIRQALAEGFDYIYLHNGDLQLRADSLSEAVKMAESSEDIGSVQSLVLYWNDDSVINTSGGAFHIAGYGYARNNLDKLAETKLIDGEDLPYASGAAVLYKAEVLKKVGLLEEGFFMYHEDLELGLRIKIAGYINVLATHSRVIHDYQFSRNPKMFAWTELYRWVVVLGYYKVATLILIMPLLLVIELGTWLMALRGGWLPAKFWAYKEMGKARTYKLIFHLRSRARELRVIKDKEILKLTVGTIEA